MGGDLRQMPMTTLEDKLPEGEIDDLEQAAEEAEKEKERRRRKERRANTKYGGLIEDE